MSLRIGHRSLLLVAPLLLAAFAGAEPDPFLARQERKKEIRKAAGGSDATEAAVTGALRWLARHQEEDGSWSPEGYAHCGKCTGTGDASYANGVTGLALLAFLAGGYVPQDAAVYIDPVTGKESSFGVAVERGLAWLLSRQAPDGNLGGHSSKQMYNHAVCTEVLAEAFGLTQEEKYRDAAQRAVDFLTKGRNVGRGWRYTPGSGESDTSATGWAVTALHSARIVGLEVDPKAFEDGLVFVRAVTNPQGLVGYSRVEDAGVKVIVQGKNEDFLHHQTMTAVGMVVRAFAEGKRGEPALDLGAKHLVCDLPTWNPAGKSMDFYYWYYATLALQQFDGPGSKGKGVYWKSWNKALIDATVPHQEKEECLAGSWAPEDRWCWEGGRVCSTALLALALETYYRFPSAFESGGKKK